MTVKAQLALSSLLTCYDPEVQLVLLSLYRVGAVWAHHFDDKIKWLVAYVSCTLASPEWRHSHLDKEACLWSTMFHQYLFGRTFHKPFSYLFCALRVVYVCIQHCAITLSLYNYTNLANVMQILMLLADCPCLKPPKWGANSSWYHFPVGLFQFTLVIAALIKCWTWFFKSKGQIMRDWQYSFSDDLQPHLNIISELCVETSYIVHGHRMIIPS